MKTLKEFIQITGLKRGANKSTIDQHTKGLNEELKADIYTYYLI